MKDRELELKIANIVQARNKGLITPEKAEELFLKLLKESGAEWTESLKHLTQS